MIYLNMDTTHNRSLVFIRYASHLTRRESEYHWCAKRLDFSALRSQWFGNQTGGAVQHLPLVFHTPPRPIWNTNTSTTAQCHLHDGKNLSTNYAGQIHLLMGKRDEQHGFQWNHQPSKALLLSILRFDTKPSLGHKFSFKTSTNRT